MVVSSVVTEPPLGSEAEPALGSECTTATPLAFAKKDHRRLRQHLHRRLHPCRIQ